MDAHVGSRVEEMACVGVEEQRQSVDETGWQAQEVGSDVTGPQAQVGLLTQSFSDAGPSSSGLTLKWAAGLSFPSEGEASKGFEFGQLCPRGTGWAVGSRLASSSKEKTVMSQA